MDTELALLLVLIVISGAFSGAEIALTSLTPAKTKTLKDDHRLGAKAVFKLKQIGYHPIPLPIVLKISIPEYENQSNTKKKYKGLDTLF